MELGDLKTRVCEVIEQKKTLPLEISAKIHQNPELGFEEVRASGWLADAFRSEGFEVETGVGDLPTAFRAAYRGGPGPTIAILAEFDALPGVGHGCGHNLICTSALSAASALKDAWPDLPGSIVVIGTPAEEGGGGGKILMLDRGVFSDVDLSMLFHPNWVTMVNAPSLAGVTINFTFRGLASHSSTAPHMGVNAADAAMLFFGGVNAFRQHVTSDARLHGYIQEAGVKASIVPDLSKVQFMVRANRLEYMEEIVERVRDIARGAALMTGATMEYDRGLTYFDRRLSKTLGDLGAKNFRRLGIEPTPVTSETARASTDAGNVSHVQPHMTITVAIADHPIRGHSEEWRDAAITEFGQNAMLTAAKVLAQTACDVFADPALLDSVREEHKAAMRP